MKSTQRVDANRVLVRQIYVNIGQDIIFQSSTYFLRLGGTENNSRKILYIRIDSDRKYGSIVRRVAIIFPQCTVTLRPIILFVSLTVRTSRVTSTYVESVVGFYRRSFYFLFLFLLFLIGPFSMQKSRLCRCLRRQSQAIDSSALVRIVPADFTL